MTAETKAKRMVLIVEDDASLRGALHDKLKLEGFLPVEARNGAEGVQFALRDQPDLILLDILMPEMDGLTVMKKIREASEWGKTVPIILLTNLNADSEEIKTAIAENKPAHFLTKSESTIDSIIEKITETLPTV
jgi:DNA-binding response OmpR family regulator